MILEPAKFAIIGKGMCRGSGWQSTKWPVDKGTKSRTKCAKACQKRKGCVAFDLSPPDDQDDHEDAALGELQCNLYGHDNIIPASAVAGNCYSLVGAVIVPDNAGGHTEVKKVIIDDGSLDKLTKTGEKICDFLCERQNLSLLGADPEASAQWGK
jgi:hypothetical protein